jgi:hypothetical protein
MKISRPSPSMVVAGLALFVSLGGTSFAAASYVANAGAVDGKSAVASSSTLSHAAGKLVATASRGTDKGRIPGKFIADVAKTSSFSEGYQVADNQPGAPQTVATIKGMGYITATCSDQNTVAGNEDPISVISFVNTSGKTIQLARRVGNGDGALGLIANQTQVPLSIGGSNTFFFHAELEGQNAVVQGGVRQDGRGTAAAVCGIFGLVTQAQP